MEESVKAALESAKDRDDATYLAVFVMIVCCILLVGIGFMIYRSLPQAFKYYSDEMAKERKNFEEHIGREREFHKEHINNERAFYKAQLDNVVQEHRHATAEVCREIRTSGEMVTRAFTELRSELKAKSS